MDYIKNLEKLTKHQAKSEKVNSYDSEDENESARLAHAIIDMSESFKVILDELSPKLMANNISNEDVEDVLLDIGEELRHIIYHIKDARFYDYISNTI